MATLIGMAVVIGVLLSAENPMLDMTCELVSQTVNCRSYAELEKKIEIQKGATWDLAS